MARSSAEFHALLSSYPISSVDKDSTALKNGHLLSVFYDNKKSQKETLKRITTIYCDQDINCVALRRHLQRLSADVSRWKKKLSNNTQWNNIVSCLDELYILPLVHSTKVPPAPSTPLTIAASSVTTPGILPGPLQCSTPEAPAIPQLVSLVNSPSGPVAQTPSPSLRRFRRDCSACQARRLVVSKLKSQNSAMKSSSKKSKLQLRLSKSLHQSLNRKRTIEKELRKERRMLKNRVSVLEEKVEDDKLFINMLKDIKDLKHQNKALRKSLSTKLGQCQEARDKVAALKREVSELQESNHYLTSLLLDPVNEPEEVTKSRAYGNTMRKCVYKSLLSQVPVAHFSDLISYAVSQLGGKQVHKVPHKSTVARMAYELSALSLLQAGEALLNTRIATLCWDATTLDTIHINTIHVTTLETTLTLSIARLPGGRATDYTNHITSVIDELANTCAAFRQVDPLPLKQAIVSKIGSTMSDRAPVNSAVVNQIRNIMDTEVVELHCNLHPLDGFANHSRKALLQMDKDIGLANNGRQCAADHFIYCVSKLRYKQTGDPVGFKAFLKRNDIPAGVFTRYVGNRMHVMFHLAGFIFQYQSPLRDYLERYCKSEFMRTNLLKGIDDQRILTQLKGLGLFGKLVTGPWMVLFYSNSRQHSNLQMVPYLQKCSVSIKTYLTHPNTMLSTTEDAFGQQLTGDATLASLQAPPLDCDLLLKVLVALASAFDKVFTNQLQSYVSGPLSEATNRVKEASKSCSPHNIWAERTLGMTDALWRRAPNASIGFLDAKVKAKTNRTLEWLEHHDPDIQAGLIRFAMRRGAYIRKSTLHSDKMVDETMDLRLTQLAQSRDKKMRRKVEKEVKEALTKRDVNSTVFDNVEGTQREWLTALVEGSDKAVGALIRHTWEEDDGQTRPYWGRIQRMKIKAKNTHATLTIGYWADGQQESSSEDYAMETQSVIADITTGDLFFM